MNIAFHSPELLSLLLLLPLLALLRRKSGRDGALVFSSTQIAQWVAQKHPVRHGQWLFFFRLLGLGLLIIALARPQWINDYSESKSSGIDILLAVDISSSMAALDFSEEGKFATRLDSAKQVIREFIQMRKYDRIGLIAFAGSPYLVSPLTLNHSWLEKNLERLRLALVEDGTAIGSAIAMSANHVKDLNAKSRIIVLLTDGINNTGKISPIVAAEASGALGIKIYTIAIGKGGVVPVAYIDEKGNFLRNLWGEVRVQQVNLPVDTETLEEVAEITGGKSYQATNRKQLMNIYHEIDNLEKTDIHFKQHYAYKDCFIYFLTFGIAFLMLEQILGKTLWSKIP